MIHGIVAIVGRPNVGKSTLFNRLTRSSKAIVDDRPGVTRDRLYGVVHREEGDGFTVIDTGGFETETCYYQPFTKNLVWEQTEQAIDGADVVLMVFDAKAGLHPHDTQLVRRLQEKGKPIVFAANKTDRPQDQALSLEFYGLGIDDLHTCAAAHNRGVAELIEKLRETLDTVETRISRHTVDPGAVRIALIGRPNAGKSSILNRLIGEERAVVSDVAGTTRDSVDTPLRYNNRPYVLIDTAGIRRRSKVKEKVESISVLRSLRVIEEADVVIMVMTPEDLLADQDARLVSLAIDQCKPVLIVVNKWDIVPDKDAKTAKETADLLRRKLKDAAYIPIMFVSCSHNQRVHKIMAQVEQLAERYFRRVPTARINEAMERALQRHTPALMKGTHKRVKFFYATQVRVAPPTIVVKCNVAKEIQESYKRYLSHRLREDLGFDEIPLRVIYRGKDENKEDAQPMEQVGPQREIPEAFRTPTPSSGMEHHA